MKIWVAAGGVWHQAGLIAALQELGHEVVNIGPVEVGGCKQIRIGSRIQRRAVTTLPGGDLLWCQWFGRRFAGSVKRRSDEVDLVIGWSSYMLEALQQAGPPVLLVRGSHHIETQAQLLGRYGPSSAIVAREIAEYERAAAVTVPTARIAKDARWSARQRVNVIESPYGFPSTAETAWGRCTPPTPIRVAVVGEVGYRKGSDRLIESLADQDVIVDVVGKRARSAWRHPKLPAGWNVHGQVDREQVQKILASSHLLLSLSREEGMQRAGQEAMAVGTPVVATKESGLSRWLDAGAGIEIQDYKPEAVRAAIEDLVDNWKEYSRKATEVASSWTWRQHADLLLAGIDSSSTSSGIPTVGRP